MKSRILVVDDEPAVIDLIRYNLRKAHYEDRVAASEKAQDLAEAAGAEAGCVVSINENTWSYFNSGWYGRDPERRSKRSPCGRGEDQLTFGPVNTGHMSVRAEVSAVYSLQ